MSLSTLGARNGQEFADLLAEVFASVRAGLTGLRDRAPGGAVLAAVAVGSLGGLVGRLLLAQYRPFQRQRRKLPPVVGAPLVGMTFMTMREGFWTGHGSYLAKLRKEHGPAYMMSFFLQNVVFVDYDLYEKHVHKLELSGEVAPDTVLNGMELLGRHSLLLLPAGRGESGAAHKRIRRRVLQAFVPKQMLLMLPTVEAICRRTLDNMVAETEKFGQSALQPHIDMLTLKVACASILGRFADPHLPYLDRVGRLCADTIAGFVSVPVDLGSFSVYGRAKAAKRELNALMLELLALARADSTEADGYRNVLGQLALPTPDGDRALTPEELQDSLITLAIAGQITTSDALPHGVALLGKHPQWVDKIAADAPRFEDGLEQPVAALRFIREAIRLRPPVAGFRRVSTSTWVSLGEHGWVPPGCSVLSVLDSGASKAPYDTEVFDPDRWTPDFAREHFKYFGGATPHACVGKNLAVVEMQTFLHLLCKEYAFEVVPDNVVVDSLRRPKYEHGLPVRIRRRGAASAPYAAAGG